MKILLKFLCFVLIAVTALSAEKLASTPVPKAPVKEKVYELPKTGVNQQRSTGGWLNVEAVGRVMVLKFFDKEKKPVPPDVDRGFAQFRYSSRNPERAPLSREGDTLTTPAKLRPPHNFLVILSLVAGESSGPAETYTIKYP